MYLGLRFQEKEAKYQFLELKPTTFIALSKFQNVEFHTNKIHILAIWFIFFQAVKRGTSHLNICS